MKMLNKVLIIDESKQRQQGYRTTLQRYHCELIVARRAEEGLVLLGQHPDVSLVLLDMYLPPPHMSALEFMQRVKEQEAVKHVPVVVVSRRISEGSVEEALALARGNLQRPFTSNEVYAVLRKIFPSHAQEPKAP